MVPKPAKKLSPLKFIIIISICLGTSAIIAFLLLLILYPAQPSQKPESPPIPTNEEPTIPKLPSAIDFQPIVDHWGASTPGRKSVIIYDLDRAELSASYQPDISFNTASLYKLFVVYEGYRRLETGAWHPDDAIVSGHTISTCLDLAIRESHSPCAEALWAKIGHANLDQIIQTDFNIVNSNISALTSSATDILKILQLYYHHPNFSTTSLEKFKDSMLNQPKTTYNWRQGLPSGFSSANVYNKVGFDWNGSSWNLFHDAAIVEFPEQNRHFIVIVMTNQVSHTAISHLGQKIETTFLENAI